MRYAIALGLLACHSPARPPDASPTIAPSATGPTLPLELVAEVPLPGGATRFDYQDLASGRLVIAHMNDASVLVLDATNGSVVKEIPNIPTARGIAIGGGRIFITSKPDRVVILDEKSLAEIARVQTGNAPDGIAFDSAHGLVGVSDQKDGAISILADSGTGKRVQTKVGSETGNVVFDAGRKQFWITAVPERLVAIDPTNASIATSIDLPGCKGAHGLRLHPDGKTAFIACEENATLVRVELEGAHALALGKTGDDPDVLAIDPGYGWLYVAAESGDLVVFDIAKPGIVLVGHDTPGPKSHSVGVDPATHRVFFPLERGPSLRIMRPKS